MCAPPPAARRVRTSKRPSPLGCCAVSGTIDASKLLRPGLLDGTHVLVAAAASAQAVAAPDGGTPFGAAVASTCAGVGARVSAWRPGDSVAADVDLLVVDGAAPFAAASAQEGQADGPRDALRECLDGAWEATRAVANAAFIGAERPGRVVYVAPVSSAGSARCAAHSDAARAGLENLARTLSIEWARYAITLVTIAPGDCTSADDVAAVTAFLASSAGAYYSGCLFDLRGIGLGAPAPGA
jgi:NAD(P)-dependent dehydrogenase (short-subunit alcohol dehydrogenase family)